MPLDTTDSSIGQELDFTSRRHGDWDRNANSEPNEDPCSVTVARFAGVPSSRWTRRKSHSLST
jgi:hypothetical protein